MRATRRLSREYRAVPLSWILVVVATFLLWMVPSTDSIYLRQGDQTVSESHDIRLGILAHSRVVAARGPSDSSWHWEVDVQGRALWLSLALSLPIAWIGRSSWRQWHPT